jgi:hypothetical protein
MAVIPLKDQKNQSDSANEDNASWCDATDFMLRCSYAVTA